MEDNRQLEQLIFRFLTGNITESERADLEKWQEASPKHRQLLGKICRELQIREEGKLFYQLDDEAVWQKFRAKLLQQRLSGRKRMLNRWIRYVAVLVIPIMLGSLGWLLFRQVTGIAEEIGGIEEIVPGSGRAILVLNNGEEKILEGLGHSVLKIDEGITVKQEQQMLFYDTLTIPRMQKTVYNTLKIPRGGEFQLVLSDGTKVWLNAGSHLRYPVVFGDADRRVFLDGEAYFEVNRDTSRPFYVETEEIYVRVYGTCFNINTSCLTETRTVLLKGSVGVGVNGMQEEIRLQPGELAGYDRKSFHIRVEKVNVSQYVAWKEGYFAFENESLEEIMEMLGRWYDVEVFFTSASLKNLKFTGYLRKYGQITQILDAIKEMVDVHFTVERHTIIVSG